VKTIQWMYNWCIVGTEAGLLWLNAQLICCRYGGGAATMSGRNHQYHHQWFDIVIVDNKSSSRCHRVLCRWEAWFTTGTTTPSCVAHRPDECRAGTDVDGQGNVYTQCTVGVVTVFTLRGMARLSCSSIDTAYSGRGHCVTQRGM